MGEIVVRVDEDQLESVLSEAGESIDNWEAYGIEDEDRVSYEAKCQAVDDVRAALNRMKKGR